MTGSLERPSQGALENRKASEARNDERDAVRSARVALVGAHKIEMQIMLARHASERRHVIGVTRAAAASARSGVMRMIAAKYADKLARVFDSGDAQSAYAARERLQLEEAIETAQATLAMARMNSDSRGSVLIALRTTQRAERQGLSIRQRRQRAVLGVVLASRRRAFRGIARPPAVTPARSAFRLHRNHIEKHR